MKNISTDLISKISQSVESSLQNDLVSHGELRQIVANSLPKGTDLNICRESVIAYLLAKDVQIGNALNVDGKYVKFVAWKGSIGERIKRAHREVELCKGSDRDFAFWLCFSSNVDEYEAM